MIVSPSVMFRISLEMSGIRGEPFGKAYIVDTIAHDLLYKLVVLGSIGAMRCCSTETVIWLD